MTTRPRCSAFIAQSLDGYIARRDGSLDWLSLVEQPDEDYGYGVFFDSIDGLLVGRATYDKVLAFPEWPWRGKRVIVATRRPLEARNGEETYAGPLAPLLPRLKAEGVRRLYVDGGQVISQLLAAGLLDDLTLSVVPTLLGDGVRLFDGQAAAALDGDRRLRLLEARSFASGLVQLAYRFESREEASAVTR